MFIKKEFEEKMRKKSVSPSPSIAHLLRSASRPKKISTSPLKSRKRPPKLEAADFLV